VHSRSHRGRGPVRAGAGVTPQLDDAQRLLADLAWAPRHGFGAKLCIHPRQVATDPLRRSPERRSASTGPGACWPPRRLRPARPSSTAE
jgi:hypothetical protein